MRSMTIAVLGGLAWAAASGMAFAQESSASPGTGDAIKGRQLFAISCAMCHKDKSGPLGPALKGVYGRKAGQLTDFKYSPGMKAANITWDEKTLDPYLAAPTKVVPGAAMPVHVPKPDDRANIIAYLKTWK